MQVCVKLHKSMLYLVVEPLNFCLTDTYEVQSQFASTDQFSVSSILNVYPSLTSIRYNCISLGLAVWAVYFLTRGCDLFGSMAFTLALNYKQMELYHAMPFFCYLLGLSFKGNENWYVFGELWLVVVHLACVQKNKVQMNF